jgi:hypothetical protein
MLIETKKMREDWLDGNATASNSVQQQKQWTSIWKIKVPSKLKVFLWRLARQSLLTGNTRYKRNMATSPCCGLCGASSDSWRHALLECHMAKCVWSLCDEQVVEHISMIEEGNAKLWIFEVMASVNHEEFISVLVTMWSIWYARRKAIFDEEYQSPLSTFSFIKNFLSTLVYTQEVKRVTEAKSVNQVSSVSKATKWIAPPPNMCKINVDAALAKSENKGAVAAVARSATGEFLGSSSVTVEGVSVPAILESLACREALALASDLNLRRIKVATDCLEVANCMRSQSTIEEFSAVSPESVKTGQNSLTKLFSAMRAKPPMAKPIV